MSMNMNWGACFGQHSNILRWVSGLLLVTACGSRVEVEPGPNAGAVEDSPSVDGNTIASGGAPAGDALLGSGGVPIRGDRADSVAGGDSGGTTGCNNPNWNSNKFDYGGSISFVPGIDCTCDVCGDSTCTGTLATVCGRITGCRATLDAAKSAVGLICMSHPAYALYSTEGEQNVISYGLGTGSAYRMAFDKETGVLVGASSSARNGLACDLGGKTELAAGLELGDSKPSCRLCADDTTDPTVATVVECPGGAIP